MTSDGKHRLRQNVISADAAVRLLQIKHVLPRGTTVNVEGTVTAVSEVIRVNQDCVLMIELQGRLSIIVKQSQFHKWQDELEVGERVVFTSLRPTSLSQLYKSQQRVFVPWTGSRVLSPASDTSHLSRLDLEEWLASLGVCSIPEGEKVTIADCCEEDEQGGVRGGSHFYQGVVTDASQSELGLFELDSTTRVFLCYLPKLKQPKDLQVGDSVTLHNVHQALCPQSQTKQLFCCLRSTIHVVHKDKGGGERSPSGDVIAGSDLPPVTLLQQFAFRPSDVMPLFTLYREVCRVVGHRTREQKSAVRKVLRQLVSSQCTAQRHRVYVLEFCRHRAMCPLCRTRDDTDDRVPQLTSLTRVMQDVMTSGADSHTDASSMSASMLGDEETGWKFTATAVNTPVLGWLQVHPASRHLHITDSHADVHLLPVRSQPPPTPADQLSQQRSPRTTEALPHRCGLSCDCSVLSGGPCPLFHPCCLGRLTLVTRFTVITETFPDWGEAGGQDRRTLSYMLVWPPDCTRLAAGEEPNASGRHREEGSAAGKRRGGGRFPQPHCMKASRLSPRTGCAAAARTMPDRRGVPESPRRHPVNPQTTTDREDAARADGTLVYVTEKCHLSCPVKSFLHAGNAQLQFCAEGVVVSPEGCSAEGVVVTPEGCSAEGVVVAPEGRSAEGVVVTPEGCSAEGVVVTPEGCSAEGVVVAPEGCSAEGVVVAPEGRSAEGVVVTPEGCSADSEGGDPSLTCGGSKAEEDPSLTSGGSKASLADMRPLCSGATAGRQQQQAGVPCDSAQVSGAKAHVPGHDADPISVDGAAPLAEKKRHCAATWDRQLAGDPRHSACDQVGPVKKRRHREGTTSDPPQAVEEDCGLDAVKSIGVSSSTGSSVKEDNTSRGVNIHASTLRTVGATSSASPSDGEDNTSSLDTASLSLPQCLRKGRPVSLLFQGESCGWFDLVHPPGLYRFEGKGVSAPLEWAQVDPNLQAAMQRTGTRTAVTVSAAAIVQRVFLDGADEEQGTSIPSLQSALSDGCGGRLVSLRGQVVWRRHPSGQFRSVGPSRTGGTTFGRRERQPRHMIQGHMTQGHMGKGHMTLSSCVGPRSVCVGLGDPSHPSGNTASVYLSLPTMGYPLGLLPGAWVDLHRVERRTSKGGNTYFTFLPVSAVRVLSAPVSTASNRPTTEPYRPRGGVITPPSWDEVPVKLLVSLWRNPRSPHESRLKSCPEVFVASCHVGQFFKLSLRSVCAVCGSVFGPGGCSAPSCVNTDCSVMLARISVVVDDGTCQAVVTTHRASPPDTARKLLTLSPSQWTQLETAVQHQGEVFLQKFGNVGGTAAEELLSLLCDSRRVKRPCLMMLQRPTYYSKPSPSTLDTLTVDDLVRRNINTGEQRVETLCLPYITLDCLDIKDV